MAKTLPPPSPPPVEVFESMGAFEIADPEKCSRSIRLQFPKFSHGFQPADFESFIKIHVGERNVTSLGRLSYPNEWQMTLSSKDVRETLLRLGRVRINGRSCWIHPLSHSEIRGYIHWLPTETPEEKIAEILRKHGEVLFIETQKQNKWNLKIDSDSRYFGLFLKPGAAAEDIPHFIKLNEFWGLITVKGRSPSCFHCREVGHRKIDCKKFREKLSSYCLRPKRTTNVRVKRGRRHVKQASKGANVGNSAPYQAPYGFASVPPAEDMDDSESKGAIRKNKRRKIGNELENEPVVTSSCSTVSSLPVQTVPKPITHEVKSDMMETVEPENNVADNGLNMPETFLGKEVSVFSNSSENVQVAPTDSISSVSNVPNILKETNILSDTRQNNSENSLLQAASCVHEQADSLLMKDQNSSGSTNLSVNIKKEPQEVNSFSYVHQPDLASSSSSVTHTCSAPVEAFSQINIYDKPESNFNINTHEVKDLPVGAANEISTNDMEVCTDKNPLEMASDSLEAASNSFVRNSDISEQIVNEHKSIPGSLNSFTVGNQLGSVEMSSFPITGTSQNGRGSISNLSDTLSRVQIEVPLSDITEGANGSAPEIKNKKKKKKKNKKKKHAE